MNGTPNTAKDRLNEEEFLLRLVKALAKKSAQLDYIAAMDAEGNGS